MYARTRTSADRKINRFSPPSFMEWSEVTRTYDSITSLFERRLRKLPAQGTHEVKAKTGRPDQVSFELYGTTRLWWVILWYNNLRFFYELVQGDTIRYPSLKDLDDLALSLELKEGLWV